MFPALWRPWLYKTKFLSRHAPLRGTFIYFSAFAFFDRCCGLVVVAKDFSVVVLYNTRHVAHAIPIQQSQDVIQAQEACNEDSTLQILLGLKEKHNCAYSINWSILKHAKPCNSGSNNCNLCTTEKLCILNIDKRFLLNERSELISRCRHDNKFYVNSLRF